MTQQAETTRGTNDGPMVYTGVRIEARAAKADLIERAKALALDPTIFDDRPPFMFTATVSTNQVDAFSTRMSASSLRNYAADADAGMPLLANHDSRQLPIGRALAGRYFGPTGNGIARTEVDFYMLPGLQMGGVSTDQVIAGLRAGIASDVSIGFNGGRWMCSICQRDVWRDRECPHIPGHEYQVSDSGNFAVCVADIEDARAIETSIVYAGATPGAMVTKIRALAADGRLTPAECNWVESRYDIAISGSAPASDERVLEEESAMTDHKAGAPADQAAALAALTTRAETAERALSEIQAAVTKALGGPEAIAGRAIDVAVAAVVAEVAELRPLADQGRAYRAAVITDALASGVRAMGPAFAESVYRGVLESQPIDAIVQFKRDFDTIGDSRLAGGRRTIDDVEAPAPRGITMPTSDPRQFQA